MTHHESAPTLASQSPMLAGLDRLRETVEAQVQSLRAAVPATERGGAPPTAKGRTAGGAPATNLEDMTVLMVRLNQMKEWLQQDQRLLAVVDDCIKQHVRKMERRVNALNLRITIIGTIAGAVLGWLLSAAQSPAMVLHTLLPH